MEELNPPERSERLPVLLLDIEGKGRGKAWVGSLVLHAGAVGVLFLIPASVVRDVHPLARLHPLIPLIAPPVEITQTAPNRGKIGREFDLQSLLPHPRIHIPPAAPPPSLPPVRAAVPRELPPAPPVVPEPAPAGGPVARFQSPPGASPVQLPPPPQIQPAEKPKLVLENAGAPSGTPQNGLGIPKIAPPSNSVNEAIRSAARRGPSGGIMVGDVGLASGGGIGPGIDLPRSPGRSGSTLELLSDPQGVDFKPYLITILAAVRRNWLAVIPESARLGRTGRVQIQFAVSRDGRVPKLVIALPSGTDAFDRAAVAGISASNPFPPLPAQFRGDQIRLQFTFLYNMPVN